jgi:hypothetical protein
MKEVINVRGQYYKVFPNLIIKTCQECGHLYDGLSGIYCKKCHIMQSCEYINIRYPEMVLEKCKLKEGDL